MSDDLVTRLRLQSKALKLHRFGDIMDDWYGEAGDEIERLREWKELAYEMRNRSWWAMRNKVLVKFDDMHKRDWQRQ